MKIFESSVDESICIGDDIEITVLEINEQHVRLAIRSLVHEPAYREETIYLNSQVKGNHLLRSLALELAAR